MKKYNRAENPTATPDLTTRLAEILRSHPAEDPDRLAEIIMTTLGLRQERAEKSPVWPPLTYTSSHSSTAHTATRGDITRWVTNWANEPNPSVSHSDSSVSYNTLP